VKLTDPLTAPLEDDRWRLGVVLALSHMQLAGCHADRNGLLGAAEQHLRESREVIERMEGVEDLRAQVDDARSDYEAESARVRLALGRTSDAIEALRASTEFDPDEADVYLLLAEAHLRAAQERVESDWQEHVRHARDACRRTEEIGGAQHPNTRRAKEIEKELARMEARSNGAVEVRQP
jgi:tetratricopeptide (TPR) repeat protein